MMETLNLLTKNPEFVRAVLDGMPNTTVVSYTHDPRTTAMVVEVATPMSAGLLERHLHLVYAIRPRTTTYRPNCRPLPRSEG